MKLDGRILATLLGLVAATQTQAAPAPNLTQSLKNARYQLVLNNDRFAGDGAAVLRGAITGARFITVGEIHLTDANPDLDRYIYGYDFLVLAPNITPATPL